MRLVLLCQCHSFSQFHFPVLLSHRSAPRGRGRRLCRAHAVRHTAVEPRRGAHRIADRRVRDAARARVPRRRCRLAHAVYARDTPETHIHTLHVSHWVSAFILCVCHSLQQTFAARPSSSCFRSRSPCCPSGCAPLPCSSSSRSWRASLASKRFPRLPLYNFPHFPIRLSRITKNKFQRLCNFCSIIQIREYHKGAQSIVCLHQRGPLTNNKERIDRFDGHT